MRILLSLLIIFFTMAIAVSSDAKVNVKNTKRLVMPIDISEPLISTQTSDKLLPKSVTNHDSGSSVISKIVDNGFSVWWDQSPIRQTSVGRAVEKVEKNMKAEIDFGRAKDSKIDHKLSIKLLAMQALAKLEYRGWVRAAINYDARAAKAEAEILESLAENKDLILSQSFAAQENKSQVSVRWNW
ncbi:MAG: hypothetical protein H7328_00085 [Bdellovibrio sp.]|nr:hypothetical protein [Bdellovibrio sp.]